MKYATSFKQLMYYEKADEIQYPLSQLTNAANYAEEHPDKRIVITLPERVYSTTNSIEKLLTLFIEYDNLYYRISSITDLIDIKQQLELRGCKKNKGFYGLPVNTYNMLYFLMEVGISDIIVGEPLIFDIINAEKVIHYDKEAQYINIRMCPAEGRPAMFNYIKEKDNGICHFWVPPQYVYLYEDYVDYLELTDGNEIREQALFEVYYNKNYLRDLNSLCKNLDVAIPCDYFDETDIIRRLSCQQKCLRPGSTKCHSCRSIADMYLLINSKKIDFPK